MLRTPILSAIAFITLTVPCLSEPLQTTHQDVTAPLFDLAITGFQYIAVMVFVILAARLIIELLIKRKRNSRLG